MKLMFPAHKYQSVTEFIPYELLNHLKCVRSLETHTRLKSASPRKPILSETSTEIRTLIFAFLFLYT